MKFALAFCFFGLQTVLAISPFEAIVEEWETWKMQHGKVYARNYGDPVGKNGYSQEESFRMKIWMENKAKIEKHNRHFYKGVHSYSLAMNEFGDLLHHEFVNVMNGYKMRSNTTSSTTGALEAMHHRATGKLVSLSEQQLVDCSRKYGNNGCNGGLMDYAFQYIKENGGIDTEKSYPYEGEDHKCRYNPAYRGATDIGFVDVEAGNENALKSAIATQGPCSVAIDASHESFQFYNTGVYREEDCSPENLDHGVLAVGYGVDQNGEAYWLIKNSWGESWGNGGYVKIARNGDNMCGVASAASYPLV